LDFTSRRGRHTAPTSATRFRLGPGGRLALGLRMTANGLRMAVFKGLSAACEAPPFLTRGEKSGLDHDQAMADAEGDGLGAAGRAQLAHDRGDVELDGVLGNLQARSDLFIAETCRDEL